MNAPGLLVERYELGERLGYGGMSEVYRARDTRLGRDVAVKTLRTDLVGDATFQERFRRAAQNAAVLNHPAIVAVYDTGEADTAAGGLPYIVMEYVAGRSLRRILTTDGPMAPRRALEVMADVCAALNFAHQHGVVHRDLKPANVMIDRTGGVKVTDFGLVGADSPVTHVHEVGGTADYLSPEQARGAPVDRRSDVYAAGCVLFEMLVGSPPFEGDLPAAGTDQRAREAPQPPSALNPAAGHELDAIVVTALAVDPADRYQSAAEMRSDLVRVLTGRRPPAAAAAAGTVPAAAAATGAGAATAAHRHSATDGGPATAAAPPPASPRPPRQPRRRRRRGAVLLGLLVLLVVGGGAWLATSLLGGGGGPTPVAMPNVGGKTSAVATAQLRKLNLTPNQQPVYCQAKANGTPAPCRSGQVGTVLRTDPSAGNKVPPRSTVAVYVAAPAQQVSVPTDLEGKTVQAATRELNRLGLQVAPNPDAVEVTDDSLFGNTVDITPAGGARVDKGSTVTLSVGKEPSTVTVPDETGLTADQASNNLENLGFDVTTEESDSTSEEGTVVDQSPSGGEAEPGSTVTLVVSTGQPSPTPTPPPDTTTPPGTTGPPDTTMGERGPDGRGTFICTESKLYFASCNPDNLGEVTQYPPYR